MPTTTDFTLPRPHRADARRNYDALLDAAKTTFAARGADVPLEDIAARAGVGIGTLYRNFPKRANLLEAVYVGEIEELVRAADEVAGLEPWPAVEAWLRRFSEYVVTKMALISELDKTSDLFRACREAMLEAATPLFERARAAGELRDDVALDDVMRMIGCVAGSHFADEEQRERIFTLAVDAVRVR